jgi:hypothetical protein
MRADDKALLHCQSVRLRERHVQRLELTLLRPYMMRTTIAWQPAHVAHPSQSQELHAASSPLSCLLGRGSVLHEDDAVQILQKHKQALNKACTALPQDASALPAPCNLFCNHLTVPANTKNVPAT